MKTTTVLLTLAIGLTLASHAHAQDPEGQVPLRRDAFEPGSRIELYKDPLVAAYLSATLPGLGHLYVGKKAHGTLFLATIVGAFGSAYAFYKPSELEITDYDRTVYGGNGDGMLSVAEAQNWEDGEYQDDAFKNLSTGRKVGAISCAAVGVGLYVWNILDARKQARAHNRDLAERRFNLGLQAGHDRAGLALRVNF